MLGSLAIGVCCRAKDQEFCLSPSWHGCKVSCKRVPIKGGILLGRDLCGMSHRAGAIGVLGPEGQWAWPCAGSGECGCSIVGWGSQGTLATCQVTLGVGSMTISCSSYPNLPQPPSTGYGYFLFLQEMQLKTRNCSNQVTPPELFPLLYV